MNNQKLCYLPFHILVPFDDREGDQFVEGAISQAINNVDRAINETQRELFDATKPKTPSDLLTLFRFPSSEASSIARAAEVFERTLQLIHERIEVGMKVNLTGIGKAFVVKIYKKCNINIHLFAILVSFDPKQ